jgi:DNA-binding NarL/FixJ family response regulator
MPSDADMSQDSDMSPDVNPAAPSADESAEPVRVVVADDQSAVREGLVLLLDTLPGITVAGQAADGEAAVEQVAALRPQVVLMDLKMPRCDGVAATRRITAEHPGTRVVVLTTYADDDSVFSALKAGARGFLTKDAGAEEIARAIIAVRDGEAQLDPSVQRRLVEALAASGPVRRTTDLPDGLTPREAEVLKLIAAGRTNAEIARELYVAESTVKTHVNNLFAKAGLRDRAQAVTYAYRHHLAEPG